MALFLIAFYILLLRFNAEAARWSGPNARSKCQFGNPLRHYTGIDFCCSRCGYGGLDLCPYGYECTVDPKERWRPVCCPIKQSNEEMPWMVRCHGDRGSISFDDSGITVGTFSAENISVAIPSSKSRAKSVVEIRCCKRSGSRQYGIIFSSPLLNSDFDWQCMAYSSPSDDLGNSARWPRAELLQSNSMPDRHEPTFHWDPRFHPSAQWIWASVERDKEAVCASCRGILRTPPWTQEEPVAMYTVGYQKPVKGNLYDYYHSFVFMFELLTDTCSDLHSVEFELSLAATKGDENMGGWSVQTLTFSFSTSTKSATRLVLASVGDSSVHWQGSSSDDSAKLNTAGYRQFYLQVDSSSGHVRFGSGRDSTQNVLIEGNNIPLLDKLMLQYFWLRSAWSSGIPDVKPIDHMRYFRGMQINMCAALESEILHDVLPCGGGYIKDEAECLSCGCCFMPRNSLMPVFAQSIHFPSCFIPLADKAQYALPIEQRRCYKPFKEYLNGVNIQRNIEGDIPLDTTVLFAVCFGDLYRHDMNTTVMYGDSPIFRPFSVTDIKVNPSGLPSWATMCTNLRYYHVLTHNYATSHMHHFTIRVVGRKDDDLFVTSIDVPVLTIGQWIMLSVVVSPVTDAQISYEQRSLAVARQRQAALPQCGAVSQGEDIDDQLCLWTPVSLIQSKQNLNIVRYSRVDHESYSVVDDGARLEYTTPSEGRQMTRAGFATANFTYHIRKLIDRYMPHEIKFLVMHNHSGTDTCLHEVVPVTDLIASQLFERANIRTGGFDRQYYIDETVSLTAIALDYPWRVRKFTVLDFHFRCSFSSDPDRLRRQVEDKRISVTGPVTVEPKAGNPTSCLKSGGDLNYDMVFNDGNYSWVRIPAVEFSTPGESEFHEVFIEVDVYRTSTDVRRFKQRFTVASCPFTEIVCRAGCYATVHFNQSVVLGSECPYCRPLEHRTLTWSMYCIGQSDNSTNKHWPGDFSVPNDLEVVVILGRIFRTINVAINCTIELLALYEDGCHSLSTYELSFFDVHVLPSVLPPTAVPPPGGGGDISGFSQYSWNRIILILIPICLLLAFLLILLAALYARKKYRRLPFEIAPAQPTEPPGVPPRSTSVTSNLSVLPGAMLLGTPRAATPASRPTSQYMPSRMAASRGATPAVVGEEGGEGINEGSGLPPRATLVTEQ